MFILRMDLKNGFHENKRNIGTMLLVFTILGSFLQMFNYNVDTLILVSKILNHHSSYIINLLSYISLILRQLKTKLNNPKTTCTNFDSDNNLFYLIIH